MNIIQLEPRMKPYQRIALARKALEAYFLDCDVRVDVQGCLGLRVKFPGFEGLLFELKQVSPQEILDTLHRLLDDMRDAEHSSPDELTAIERLREWRAAYANASDAELVTALDARLRATQRTAAGLRGGM